MFSVLYHCASLCHRATRAPRDSISVKRWKSTVWCIRTVKLLAKEQWWWLGHVGIWLKNEPFLVQLENVSAVDGWMEGLVGSFQHSSKASSALTAIVGGEESYQWICVRLVLPTVPSAPSCFATGILWGRGVGVDKKGTLLAQGRHTPVWHSRPVSHLLLRRFKVFDLIF